MITVTIYGGSNCIQIHTANKNPFPDIIKFHNISQSGASLKDPNTWNNVPKPHDGLITIGIQANSYFLSEYGLFVETYKKFIEHILELGWKKEQIFCVGPFPRGPRKCWPSQRHAAYQFKQHLSQLEIQSFSFFELADPIFLRPELIFSKKDMKRKIFVHLNFTCRKRVCRAIMQFVLKHKRQCDNKTAITVE